jgi:hypothetical protein
LYLEQNLIAPRNLKFAVFLIESSIGVFTLANGGWLPFNFQSQKRKEAGAHCEPASRKSAHLIEQKIAA